MFWMLFIACANYQPVELEQPVLPAAPHAAELIEPPEYRYNFEAGEVFEVSLPENHEWAQHHATVALSRKGGMIVVWMTKRFVNEPTSWLRMMSETGDDWGTLELNKGFGEAAPDVVMSGRGYAVVAAEIPGEGVGVEIVNTTTMTSVDEFMIASPTESDGENRVDLLVTPEDGVYVGWYSGGASRSTGTFYLGGLEANFGDILAPRPIGYSTHYKTLPPDLAMMPEGEIAFAWSDVDSVNGDRVDLARVLVSRVDADRNVVGTVLLHESRPGPPAAPRPSVVANEAGRVAVTWQAEAVPGSGVLRAVLATLDREGNFIATPFPAGPLDSASPIIKIVDQDNLLIAYEHADGVWAALYSWDGTRIADPVRVSPVGAIAQRPALAIRRIDDDSWQIAATWEQTIDDEARQVWGTSARILRSERD